MRSVAAEDGLLLVLHLEHAIEREIAHLVRRARRNASRSIVSACAPGRLPGAWVEKWIFWLPSSPSRSRLDRRTSSRIERPRGRRSRWWKRSRRPGRRFARPASRTCSSGIRSSFSRRVVIGLRRELGESGSKRARSDPTWSTILCDESSPRAISKRSWYSSSATAVATTSGLAEERTVYCPGWVERRAPDRAAAIRSRRAANSSHQRGRSPDESRTGSGSR